MIQEQLAHLPEFLPDYRPFPPVKEHTAWQGQPLPCGAFLGRGEWPVAGKKFRQMSKLFLYHKSLRF